ncbi:activator of Hsp90 ATPase [Mucidula mucida]|nr:activator of Hsp90 ATPase [Mucidula mucida]
MSSVPAPSPNKNVTKWGHEWFKTELTNLKAQGETEGEAVWIADVFDVDGDIELGQRKSKLITIFDCRLTINWAGTASDGAEVKGRIDVPEVSHENTVDDQEPYGYMWSMTTSPTPEATAVFNLAKSRLTALMDAVFRKFPATMLDVHGRDLTVSADASRSGTPAPSTPAAAPSPSPAAAAAAAPPKPVKKPDVKAVNTTTVTVEGNFAASADDLFGLLTDEKRIPMWTRAPAQSAAKADTEYSLFGGGVKGTYIALTRPTEIIQSWALSSPTWPSDHTAQLTTTLAQGSDSTKVTFTLAGVPLGVQDEIKRNLEGYYIHGFKSIGYVQINTSSYVPVIAISVLIFAAAFSIPFLSSRS